LRSKDKVKGEVEKLTREIEVLKNHISQIKIGQTQNNIPHSNNIYQNEGQTSYNNEFSFYNRNQHYQTPIGPIFNNPNEYYQNNPRPNFYPSYNYSTNNNQMIITQFPRPNFYQNYNYNNTNNNQLSNTQRPTQINQGTIPHTNYAYGNQQGPPICFQCGIPGHIKRNCNTFVQKKLIVPQITGSAQKHQYITSNIPLNMVKNTKTNNTIYTYYDNNKEKIKIEINDQTLHCY